MTHVHPLLLSDLTDHEPVPALNTALAGGSDRPPPDDEPRPAAEIIRFPVERVRQERRAGADQHRPASGEAFWPAWMSRVLSRRDQPSGASQTRSPVLDD